jgi:PAS domain S-box-containing protein
MISLVMAWFIAYLAFRHKREYEAKLHAHNEALEATRDFLSRIIEGSAEAIITLDPSGHVTSWIRSAERIFGWSADEMLGQSALRVVPPEPAPREDFARMNEVVRSGEPVHDYETDRVRKDGRRITVRITRSPIYDGNGNFLGSTSILRDVTALKEMETKLLEAERLAAVGELAASVAHEIKNPLAGIRGACEILSDAFQGDDPRRDLHFEVQRQIERLDRTLKDLLLFARPQAMRPERCNLNAVLDGVLAVLLEDTAAKTVAVERHYADDLPEIHVDRLQMEQVLINILINAFQAMDYKGRLTITTRANGEVVQVAVRDSGPGIPAEVADNIFKPFFTTRSKGTGLGLAIVRNIVRSHGGTITAATVPGGGAEFTLSVPQGGSSDRE